jgi:hypothetical protein
MTGEKTNDTKQEKFVYTFLDVLAKLWKAPVSFFMHVRPSVRMEQLDSHGRDFMIYRVIKKPLCTWWLQYRKLHVFEQSPHNWWFEDGHHRIHSECGPCYTEHGLREHSSACQQMSGDWQGTFWILLVPFCIVIISSTETFWSSCIIFQYFSKIYRGKCKYH